MPSSHVGMCVLGKLCGKENIIARPQERRRKNPSAPAKLLERPRLSGVKKITGQYCPMSNLA